MDEKKKSGADGTQSNDANDSGRRRRAKWKRTSTGVVSPPALLDRLTGLPNRRCLEAALHSDLEELRRYDRRFGVLLVDIDNFREVNDVLGRKAGDKVLRSVGRVLNRSTRPFDTVGRAGGEEFLATIANVNADTLRTVAEKLRRAIEELDILTASDSLKVTVSIGGTLATAEDTKEVLIKRAYRCMRKGKDLGRNCVNIEIDDSPDGE